ncbi:MAG: histidine phosphatase family protein [Chloroflexi bacterium]|nr:histidine phosphatase family protein [Chloroflexota bacterium]
MTTTLLLIRHGQTDWNVAGRWQGHADIPLNETGKAQANALAERLADWPIKAIYSSDLMRCVQTATAVSNTTGITPIYNPIWRERDVGEFSGFTSQQVREKFPEVWKNAKRGMVDPPNGEAFLDLRKRSMAAFEETIAQHNGDMIAVFSHGGVLHTLIAQIIGIDKDEFGRFTLRGNTGISIIEIEEHGARLTLLNDVNHLSCM